MVIIMTKILMRSGMSPFDNFNPSKVIVENSIGSNSGNLVYAYSLFRTLMTEGTEIDSTYYRLDYTEREIKKINENYDCFVIPLADAFRKEYVDSLKAITRLVRLLKIPAIVIGVGLRASFEPKLENGFPFDEAVKDFMNAVLEKSAIVGVRGQITADYLTKLGYIEGKHHMVIGCPSMYMFGRDLNIRDTKITKDSFVCVNNSSFSPKNVLDFIESSSREFSNVYFIPQRLNELKMTYFGIPNPLDKDKPNYPHNIEHYLYEQDRVRFFINFREWSKFLSKADFCFGARMHGNISSVLSGTPSLIIPKDARMREIAEYHNLTRVRYGEINKDTSIWDLIEKADFKSPCKNHHKNFDNYRDFLKINGLENIFENEDNPADTPFDIKISNTELQPAVTTYNSCSRNEAVMRTNEFVKYSNGSVRRLKTRLSKRIDAQIVERKKLKEQINYKNKIIEQKNKIIADKEKIINLKSVRFALRASRMIGKFKINK